METCTTCHHRPLVQGLQDLDPEVTQGLVLMVSISVAKYSVLCQGLKYVRLSITRFDRNIACCNPIKIS